jgi:hypothetical protein
LTGAGVAEEDEVRIVGLIALWIVCVLIGGAAGYLVGYVLWQLGFKLIGSAVALVGAGCGGIVVFLGLLAWWDQHRHRSRSQAGRVSG